MDLPNEIIREICNRPELEREDLRSLRLTSKHLCECALHRFAKESFSSITVLMSRSCLRAFIELSQHPYFGSVVEKINISPKFVPYELVANMPPPAPSEVPTNIYSTQVTQLVAKCVVKARKEHQLSTDGSVERMLSVAFKAFAQREQCLQLEFRDRELNAIGVKEIWHDKTIEECLVWRLDWKTTLEQTIRAVTRHNCRITKLEIDERSRDNSEHASSLCTDDIEQDVASLCSQLTHLDIYSWNDGIETTMKSAKRMVSAAKNLTSLDLLGFSHLDYLLRGTLQQTLKCVASTSLEHIFLLDFQISERELIEFLGRQRGTLQVLCLYEGCLLTGSCKSLVSWLRDNMPGLLQLELEDICQYHDDQTNCRDETYRSYWVHRGEDMRARLTDILDGKCEQEPEEVKEGESAEVEQVEGNDV